MTQQQQLPGIESPDSDDDRDHWQTPDRLFRPLNDKLRFTLDLAANEHNAKLPRYWTKSDDALSREWPRGEWLWLNPPFSELRMFAEMVQKQTAKGSWVVMLTPAHRCEQWWWQLQVLGSAAFIVYPRGRVEYVAPPGVAKSGPEFPSVLLVYDGTNRDGVTRAITLEAFLGTTVRRIETPFTKELF